MCPDKEDEVITQEEERWLEKAFDSLRAECLELDKWAWQIPMLLYGTVGVVVGVVFRVASWEEASPILPATFFALAVLLLGGVLLLQRLHERKGYRREQMRENIIFVIGKQYKALEKVNVVPGSGDITRYAKGRGIVPQAFGRFSSTAVGVTLLALLFILLVICGISRLEGQCLLVRICIPVGFILSIFLLYVLSWLHHRLSKPKDSQADDK